MLHAFIDESEKLTADGEPRYLLVASLCEESHFERTRSTLLKARGKSEEKLHWHGSEPDAKIRYTRLAVEADQTHNAVVLTSPVPSPSERMRRLCMEDLLFELQRMQVRDATFESRGPAADKRDRELVDTMRAKRALNSSLRIDHATGPSEPLLWIPDFVCGMLPTHVTDTNLWTSALTSRLHVIPVER